MPLWATVAVLSVVTGIGGYLLRYLNASSRLMGKIDQAFTDHSRRLDRIEEWQADRDSELVAYRNGYRERPRR